MPRQQRGGPIDPALLKRFPVLQRFLVLRTVSSMAGAALTVALVLGIARVLAPLAVGDQRSAPSGGVLVLLAVVLVGRCALAWWNRWSAESTASAWKRQLRVETAAAVRARAVRGESASGAVATLVTKGVDTVDAYVTGPLAALPDAVVGPTVVLGVLFVLDWPSALVVLATLPIVPLLLALVGLYTQERTKQQLSVLLRMGTQFVEAVSGLVTLRVLGRQDRTALRVRESADAHRAAAVSTLRVAFLSSFVLETITSLAVALIAVPVGFRLLGGEMTLATGLAVLMLTPEAYRSLRVLGMQFHAAQDTRAVLDELARITRGTERIRVRTGRPSPAPDPSREPIELRGLTVGFDTPVLAEVSMTLEPRRTYAVVGASGAGKTTLMRTVAGVLPPLAGGIRVGDTDLSSVDPASWIRRIGVVAQRPYLFSGTVGENIRLGCPDADPGRIWLALERAGAAGFVHLLPGRLDARIGERAGRLSVGERQRLALARALVREPALLLLDEPTARLDGETERCVLQALEQIAASTTVLVVTHRPRVADQADAVIEVADGRALLAARTARTGV
jgi:thiol reductant ABC exporter CydD subunit